ncbi:MAG: 4Fe-4S dicluster domain-containing protein [Acidimicrobiales bacterium]|nr:4Fe-4S dicluster domain-containing protein [Acidimicrobiales bacterium]
MMGRRDPMNKGFEVLPDFERFSQVDDVFSRSWWDRSIRSDKSERFYATYRRPLTMWRKANGFTQRDYALRNASWHVSDVFTEMGEDQGRRDGFLDPLSMLRDGPEERVDDLDPDESARQIKNVATVFGADLVGIAEHDERWVYTERFSAATGEAKPNPLPDTVSSVIVIGQAMDQDLIQTAPSALSGTATGLGYSRDAAVLLGIAQYIKNLGYEAVPSMNDTALAIPLALAAGLGEYGRHGMVITPEFGAGLRFGKIFTDLPLAHDGPVQFGVKAFCEQCNRCADACPARAIPQGEPVPVALNRSGIKGVRKWSVDGEACFGYWSKINSDCAICVRVCPYTRDYSKPWNRWWRRLAGTRLRSRMLALDDRLGGGRRLKPTEWWRRG